jgi:hypothetical protein
MGDDAEPFGLEGHRGQGPDVADHEGHELTSEPLPRQARKPRPAETFRDGRHSGAKSVEPV